MPDPFTLAAISGLASLGGSMIGADSQKQANAQNERLMLEGWRRDDQQVQRRVQDLMAAGLHPTLASGGGSTSQPTTIQPEIKNNPVEGAVQSAQRVMDINMSKTQQELVKKQLEKEGVLTEIEKQRQEIFEKTGILLGPNSTTNGLPTGALTKLYTKGKEIVDKSPEKIDKTKQKWTKGKFINGTWVTE